MFQPFTSETRETFAGAPESLRRFGWQQPIACGGVAIFPGDLIVADRDGAVVVPQDLIVEVAELGLEQERLEGWIMKEVERGAKLPGLYPINDENRARYEADMKKGG